MEIGNSSVVLDPSLTGGDTMQAAGGWLLGFICQIWCDDSLVGKLAPVMWRSIGPTAIMSTFQRGRHPDNTDLIVVLLAFELGTVDY
jgi:hypothetical protein